jgi:peroxiredoxin
MAQKSVRTSVPTGDGQGRGIKRRDVFVTLGIIALIVGIFFAFNRPNGEGEGAFTEFNPFTGSIPFGPRPEIGSPAPDFQVELLDGEIFRLSEQKGKVVWINFWASWCPPCRAEMPDIEAIWQEEQNSDLVVVAVDFAERPDEVREFAERLGMTFPVGLDTTGQITTNYRVSGFPSHFLVDREGILREIRVGLMSQKTMRQKLEDLRSY